jgi:hypothetical protein
VKFDVNLWKGVEVSKKKTNSRNRLGNPMCFECVAACVKFIAGGLICWCGNGCDVSMCSSVLFMCWSAGDIVLMCWCVANNYVDDRVYVLMTCVDVLMALCWCCGKKYFLEKNWPDALLPVKSTLLHERSLDRLEKKNAFAFKDTSRTVDHFLPIFFDLEMWFLSVERASDDPPKKTHLSRTLKRSSHETRK